MPPRPRLSRESADKLDKILIAALTLNVAVCFGAYFSGRGQQSAKEAQLFDVLDQARARRAALSEPER
jgi:hypothetical protein